MTRFVAVFVVAAALVVVRAAGPSGSRGGSFADAGRQATATLVDVYYGGAAGWRACDSAGCPVGNVDWGYDSLTYALALRAAQSHDQGLLAILSALAAGTPAYPPACAQVAGCGPWSDTAEWDAVALADEYQATGDQTALAKAEAAFAYVAGSQVFALGACPSIPYQKPGGGSAHLKTLETEANAVKAALLLYRATRNPAYLTSALAGYGAARAYFLDPRVSLYTVYLFDDGRGCRQLPHRFFASVNGDMIWSGLELYRDTGQRAYLEQATATAAAVEHDLSDGRGVFADLQAENDVVEPLVEAMDALAQTGQGEARHWLLSNAGAALSARTPDGSFGRFFDGPPPAATVTAWQTNGGLALEIAAAAIAPNVIVRSSRDWAAAKRVGRQMSALPESLSFRGFGIALLGTLGERCCERGHARVLVDGRETFDRSGIWQNKSSVRRRIAGTVLFAWRWRTSGRHTLTLLPGSENQKEGGSFLHLAGYQVLGHG
jgi:hypothetical protein